MMMIRNLKCHGGSNRNMNTTKYQIYELKRNSFKTQRKRLKQGMKRRVGNMVKSPQTHHDTACVHWKEKPAQKKTRNRTRIRELTEGHFSSEKCFTHQR